MAKEQLGLTKRITTAIKAASLAWGGAQSTRSHLPSGISSTLVGGIPVSAIRLSSDTFYTIHRNHGDIFGCVRELSQGVGVAGWYWENKANPDADPNPQSVKMAEAILTANGTMRAWYREIMEDASIVGNAYYYIEKSLGNGKPLGLCRVDPRTMTAVTDKYGTLIRWIQRAGADMVDFKPEEIVHFVTQKDKNSTVYGISPMEPILWDVRTDLAAMISNYALFENDGVPAAMYVFEDEMSEEQIKIAVEKLKREMRGAENRHRSIAMQGLKEVKTVSITNKDMEFSTLRRLTTEKVCAAYGVPKTLLGYTDGVNYSSNDGQDKKFWEGTIQPYEEQLEEFINRKVLPLLGIVDLNLKFNPRDFDNREWNEASTRADVQLGIMTINEARIERELEPYDTGKHGELVDAPIIYGGLGARPLEDIGVDMDEGIPAVIDEDSAEKALHRLGSLGERVAPYAKQKSKS